MGSAGIEAAWAGGIRGREVTDRFLPAVAQLLSSDGLFYLITIAENDPSEFRDVPDTIQGQKTFSRMEFSPIFFFSLSISADEIIRLLGCHGLTGEAFLSKRAGNERLSVLRFHKS